MPLPRYQPTRRTGDPRKQSAGSANKHRAQGRKTQQPGETGHPEQILKYEIRTDSNNRVQSVTNGALTVCFHLLSLSSLVIKTHGTSI